MAVIRCKICGGDLNIADGTTVAVCEYCGTRQTLPKINDEQRAAAFNRGDHFRRISEFDKALSVYERIIAEDDTDAEAHWCAALSRYGIEYVKDPASGKYIPTCHRASFTNFLEDVDYQAAVANADPVAREQYEHDGRVIAEVQRNIIETVNKEAPFDVFICYKESDDRGQRTLDSTLAQDIYYRLTDQGYRVFFSRITLEDKAGQQYEPYIFAALHSAKVMIVIGTRPEYMNAVWVKNEWSRYLALMKNDRIRLLIPCYRDMDPYDMPEQLSVLQSYDMTRIGFIQDLIRGISKVLGADKPKEKETVIVQQASGNTSLDAQIKRGNISLEDGDFKAADNSFDRALDINPECAEAYLGKALAEYKCRNIDNFIALHTNTDGRRTKQTINIPRRNEAAIEQSVKKHYIPNYFEPNIIRNIYRRDTYSFQSEGKSLYDILQTEYEYLEHDKYFGRAFICGDTDIKTKLINVKNTILSGLQSQIDQSKAVDDIQYHRILDTYTQEFQVSERQTNQHWQAALQKRESDYQEVCASVARINNIGDCDQLITRFRYIGVDYKDVQSRINVLEQEKLRFHQKELDLQKEEEKKLRKSKTIKIFTVIASIITVIVLFIIYQRVIKPSIEYNKAEELLVSGQYDDAILAFTELGNYKDSNERIYQVYYEKGDYLHNMKDYDNSLIAYKEAGNYEDAKEKYDSEVNQMEISKIFAFEGVTVGLRKNGSVAVTGSHKNDEGYNIQSWRDIIDIFSGRDWLDYETVGIKTDGKVISVCKENSHNKCNISEWSDIKDIAIADDFTFGLKKDGSILIAGKTSYSELHDATEWRDIIAIAAGNHHVVGLKSDGTVVALGEKCTSQLKEFCPKKTCLYGECDVSKWNNIIAIAAGDHHILGLKSDGTVIAAGWNKYGQCNVSDWNNIIAIAASGVHSVGLKSDGTVVSVGNGGSNYPARGVSDWKDIVAISASTWNTVGLTSDGKIECAGSEKQCDFSGWERN